MQEDGERLVEIQRFEYPMQADLVRTMLESHGIDAIVRDDRLSFSLFSARRPGVRLSVRPEDADRARWLMTHGVYGEDEEPDWDAEAGPYGFVEIAAYRDRMEAEVIRAMLKAKGLEAHIDAPVRGGRLGRCGIGLAVPAEQAEHALWLIAHHGCEDGEERAAEDEPSAAEGGYEITVRETFGGGAFEEAPEAPAPFAGENEPAHETEPAVCPNCGSADIGGLEPSRMARLLLGQVPRWMCRDCEWEWRA